MYSDTTADLLTRIRNAYAVKKAEVSVPFSKFKQAISEVLLAKKYLDSIEVLTDGVKKSLKIKLKYNNNQPAIKHIERVSKSGRRAYLNHNQLPHVQSDYGHALISTSKGVMTAVEARKKSLGGEIICKVW